MLLLQGSQVEQKYKNTSDALQSQSMVKKCKIMTRSKPDEHGRSSLRKFAHLELTLTN